MRRPPRSPLFLYTTLSRSRAERHRAQGVVREEGEEIHTASGQHRDAAAVGAPQVLLGEHLSHRSERDPPYVEEEHPLEVLDRKSTRLNSSHANISYAVFCL